MVKRELTKIVVLAAIGLVLGLVLMVSFTASSPTDGLAATSSWTLLLVPPLYVVGLFYGARFILAGAVAAMKTWVIGLLHCRSWIALLIVLILPIILMPIIIALMWIPGCIMAIVQLVRSYGEDRSAPKIGYQGRPSGQINRPTHTALPEDGDFDF